MMRLYIPIGKNDFICIENGEMASIVRGVPDPFSRVARPIVRWSLVQGDLPFLTKREIARAKRSRIAYTRLWEEPR